MNDTAYTNFLKTNFKKFGQIIGSVGNYLKEHADTIDTSLDLVNAERDIK